MKVIGFVFVDDSDLVKIATDNETIQEITMSIQKMINQWQKLLQVTGGVLVPENSWFTPVNFKWKNGKCSYNVEEIRLTMEDYQQS